MEYKKNIYQPSYVQQLPVVITFIIIGFLYLWFQATNIGFGDSIGFYSSIEYGFDPATSATDHFLYKNTLILFAKLIPFISDLRAAVLFSVLSSLLTLGVVYKIVRRQTETMFTGLAACSLLALSFTFWRQTEIIEVYSFNNLIFSWMLLLVLKDLDEGKNEFNYTTSFLFGCSLLVHIQNILLVPFFIFYLYITNKTSVHKKIIYSLIIVLVLFSILIILPLIFNTNSIQSVFFQSDKFQNKVLGIDLGIILKGAIKSLGYFFYNFSIFSFFIVHGFYLLYRSDKRKWLLFLLIIIPFWGFAMRYDVPDNYVFFLQSYIALVILSSYSFLFWMNKFYIFRFVYIFQLLIIPFIYFLSLHVALNIPKLQELHRQKLYKGGLHYLLWPGMRNNTDMLKLSKEIYNTGVKPDGFEEFEWNYNGAIKYLKSKGEIK